MGAEIRYLRLEDGTDLIGKVVKEHKDFIEIECPIRAVIIPQSGQVAIAPYLPFTSEKVVTIPKLEIKYNLTPEQDMVNMWNKQYGSGLVTPPKPGLVLPQ